VRVIDGTSGREREASPEEVSLLARDGQVKAEAGASAASADGLEIAATTITGGARRGSFRARQAGGAWAICTAPACEGAANPWWGERGTRVRFFRREGWARASTAIHEWNIPTGAVRRLYVTDDLLSSCTPAERRLLCRVDSSLEPGRLDWLDPATGRRETLFDPNPEFARLTLGKPERLHLRNRFGSETIADLVLPVDYREGRRYPMVVVQYETRGFLRGGTADEYPIQAFANRGYAVLSFKRPFLASILSARDPEQAGKQNLKDFADRKNVHASLEDAVRLVIARGIADSTRIGITGLSDGSSTVEWALIHSRLFSAAATSSCCWDPTGLWLVGPSAARHFRAEGYPGALGRHGPFWKEVSLSDNANHLSTPILVNASEEEVLDALFTYTALREAGVPIDLFVYPEEYHARWQPAHRLATYQRSLDWFDYWLRGVRSGDPRRAVELKAWDGLREEAERRGVHRQDRARAPDRSLPARRRSTPRH
jgi:dipeptidyl aminopeptidase/acylaminoacyl peptidase